MQWTNERAEEEFRWLTLMSRLKYDGYRAFLAGALFIESLIAWLQQFESYDRAVAYEFVRSRIVYFGPAEMQRLIESIYPDHILPLLISDVAAQRGCMAYEVRLDTQSLRDVSSQRRKTIFVGLSEGARLDAIRHANHGTLTNDQFVLTSEVNSERWGALVKKLQNACRDESARFRYLVAVDDFVASGTTLLRKESSGWDGKLIRLYKALRDAEQALKITLFEPDWTLYVHHHIGSSQAVINVEQRVERAGTERGTKNWFPRVLLGYGLTLPYDLPITKTDPFAPLVERYYDPAIETEHNLAGGATSSDVRWGYQKCALPVVLQHNTPNNSLALLWAESDGSTGNHAMRPLFHRVQRHDRMS